MYVCRLNVIVKTIANANQEKLTAMIRYAFIVLLCCYCFDGRLTAENIYLKPVIVPSCSSLISRESLLCVLCPQRPRRGRVNGTRRSPWLFPSPPPSPPAPRYRPSSPSPPPPAAPRPPSSPPWEPSWRRPSNDLHYKKNGKLQHPRVGLGDVRKTPISGRFRTSIDIWVTKWLHDGNVDKSSSVMWIFTLKKHLLRYLKSICYPFLYPDVEIPSVFPSPALCSL